MKSRFVLLLLTLVVFGAVSGVGQTRTYDGYNLPPGWMPPVHDSTINYLVLFEKFEFRTGQAEDAAVLDAQGWIGGDYHRFWWKAEGEQERRRPKTGEIEVQALYGRMIHAFWDALAGVRFDRRYSGRQRDTRTHLALGLQGTAPYGFELEPMLFVSDEGDVTFEFEASFEQLITQRLVIEPTVELAAAAQDDPHHAVGRGFNELEIGLRLRYEFSRQFAPYVGVTWRRALGGTAGLHRRAGERVSESAVVFGVRGWF